MPDTSSGFRPLEERLRLIEERFQIGSWSWERATDDVQWSAGLYRLLGVDAGAVNPSLNFYESLAHPQDRLPFADSERIATDARQKSRLFRLIRPDGGLRWIRSLAQTVFDRTGAISRVIAIAADTTELEETRRALRSAEAFDIAIARLLRMEFWRADETGQLLEVTTALADSRETAPRVYAGGWQAIVPESEHARLGVAWLEAVRTQSEYVQSHPLILAGGQVHEVHVRGAPFADPGTERPRWAGVATLSGGVVTPAPLGNREVADGLPPAQIRAARAHLGWSAEHLAAEAGVSLSTIRRLERDSRRRVRTASTHSIFSAFERAGLSFWRDPAGRPYFVAG